MLPTVIEIYSIPIKLITLSLLCHMEQLDTARHASLRRLQALSRQLCAGYVSTVWSDVPQASMCTNGCALATVGERGRSNLPLASSMPLFLAHPSYLIEEVISVKLEQDRCVGVR